ncbi:MAG: hypothetical protein HZA59_14115 [Hydrogenophilales bacterium]|nr:hypothetical protein [Hydrogenophilales bacterium]
MNSSFMTVCVGRFLIEVPHATKVIDEKYEIMGARLEFTRMGLEKHKEFLLEREKALRADKNDPLKKMAHVPKAQGAVFVYGDDDAPVIYKIEGYAWSKDLLGGIQLKINGLTNLINMDQRIQTVSTELARFRHRRDNDIPAEDGFCVNGGFFAGRPSMESEFALIYYRLTQHPDVLVKIIISVNGTNLEPTLLQRNSEPLPPALKSQAHLFKMLRRGKHPVGPLAGEEVLELFNNKGLGRHEFYWQVQGKPTSLYEPAISFELITGRDTAGQEVKPSLTNQQAIELFDRIVNSIRLRPTTPGKTSDAGDPNSPSPTPKRLPLGTKVSSLRSCPETGVYECPAGAPGVTERRMHIKQHQPMPSAFVVTRRRGVAGFFGGQVQKEVETIWTLVAYDKDAS